MTTSSTFAPPLWIPYAMMAFGMSLLTLQILVQVFTHLTNKRVTKDQMKTHPERSLP